MFSGGSWSRVALAAVTATLVFSGAAVADRGGTPNGGRDDRPAPQGPPAAQQRPQEKATPPGQEQRPESAPAPPGQDVRTQPRPRRAEPPPEPQSRRAQPESRSNAAPRVESSQSPNDPPGREGNPNENVGGGPGSGGPGTPDAPPEERGQNRVTICHSTGSDTNTFVEITIAEEGLNGHRRHGDIIPAPAGGCPGSADRERDGDGDPERIDICHATGSETNPYVLLEDMPLPSLNGHGDHQGDIIPAPEDGVCPTAQQPAGTLTADIPASAFAVGGDSGTPPPTDSGGVAGLTLPASGVLGQTAAAPAQAAAGNGSHRSDPDGSLPFTGLSLLLMAALGAGVVAGGLALRRGTYGSRVTWG